MLIIHADKREETKFNVGDQVYLVKNIRTTELCPKCGGCGYVNVPADEGVQVTTCDCCQGNNTVAKTRCVPLPTPAVVEEIRVHFTQNNFSYTYILRMGTSKVNRTDDKMFPTYEAANKFCVEQNRTKKKMLIEDIVIPHSFTKTIPSPEKIAKRMEELRKHGKFTNMIEVDVNNVLVDGYTTYVLAKGFGYTKMEVIVHDEVKNV